MNTSMFDYVKMILAKVSFNRKLFRKEYRKSLKMLNANESSELKVWLRENGLAVVRQPKSDKVD